jgi:dTDP-4-dehydrorhamnose 3,5-epimerase-like enzyme
MIQAPFKTLDDVHQIIPKQKISDTGCISIFEYGKEISHPIKRIFTVSSFDKHVQRGKHAHKRCHQTLFCISGSCTVTCDDGKSKIHYFLDESASGAYIPPSIWAEQNYHSLKTVILVMCDLLYDERDYIRCYDEFLLYRSNLNKNRFQEVL